MIQRHFINQFLLRWLVTLMVLPGIVQAQAVPASLMQRAIAGITQSKMATRGFASNDPRWGATLQANGSAIAGGAAAAAVVTAAGVTAPAWVTAGAVIALGALFTAGINLAIDGIKWLFNSDGSITTSSSPAAPQLLAGQCFRNATGGQCYGSITDVLTGGSGAPPAITNQYGTYSFTLGNLTCAPLPGLCTLPLNALLSRPDHTASSFVYSTYSATVRIESGTPLPVVNPDVMAGGPSTVSPTAAIAALSDADKAKPANPDILAAIADQAWKQAAQQPGYAGYPYDAANPITAADAAAWQAANPQAWPTVGDIVAPQPTSSGSSSPFSLPNSVADPAPSTGTDKPPAETGTTFDWSIPNTGEAITKQAVPVSYVPTVFAAPTGCPAPVTFTMFGKQYAIAYSPFCDLMTTLAPIFLACGAAAAALIFAESLKS